MCVSQRWSQCRDSRLVVRFAHAFFCLTNLSLENCILCWIGFVSSTFFSHVVLVYSSLFSWQIFFTTFQHLPALPIPQLHIECSLDWRVVVITSWETWFIGVSKNGANPKSMGSSVLSSSFPSKGNCRAHEGGKSHFKIHPKCPLSIQWAIFQSVRSYIHLGCPSAIFTKLTKHLRPF